MSGPSMKEMGLKPEETRILGDAELIKGGARKERIKDGGTGEEKVGERLEVTARQIKGAKAEMDRVLLFEKNLKLSERARGELARFKKILDEVSEGVEDIETFVRTRIAEWGTPTVPDKAESFSLPQQFKDLSELAHSGVMVQNPEDKAATISLNDEYRSLVDRYNKLLDIDSGRTGQGHAMKASHSPLLRLMAY